MIDPLTLVLVVILYLVCRLLHLASPAEKPQHFYKRKSALIQTILKSCPTLTEAYVPTLLWGKSGHLQTIIYAKLGRVKPKRPEGKRHYIVMQDGATMSFDVFDPHKAGEKDEYIIVVCPGIANSSEAGYIRTFVNHAQTHGYTVAVLNHLGALRSEKLTSPRMFTYGRRTLPDPLFQIEFVNLIILCWFYA